MMRRHVNSDFRPSTVTFLRKTTATRLEALFRSVKPSHRLLTRTPRLCQHGSVDGSDPLTPPPAPPPPPPPPHTATTSLRQPRGQPACQVGSSAVSTCAPSGTAPPSALRPAGGPGSIGAASPRRASTKTSGTGQSGGKRSLAIFRP